MAQRRCAKGGGIEALDKRDDDAACIRSAERCNKKQRGDVKLNLGAWKTRRKCCNREGNGNKTMMGVGKSKNRRGRDARSKKEIEIGVAMMKRRKSVERIESRPKKRV